MTALVDELLEAARPRAYGRVRRIVGLEVEIEGITAPIGATVEIPTNSGVIDAEVVAIHDGRLACMPYGELTGVEVAVAGR